MDELVSKAGQAVINQGIIGVFLVGMSFVAWRLFSLYMIVQEKRIEESQRYSAALAANTAALETLTGFVRSSPK